MSRIEQLMAIQATIGAPPPTAAPAFVAESAPLVFFRSPFAPTPSGVTAKREGSAGLSFADKVHLAIDGPIKLGAESEVARICSMPVVQRMTREELDQYSYENVLASAYQEGFRLFDIQAEAHRMFTTYGCLFGPIGVGWGKTLLSLMFAEHMFTKLGIRRVLLCIPAEVLTQLVGDARVPGDIKWARTKVPLTIPIHVLGGRTPTQRMLMATSGKEGLFILPYSMLQTKDTDAMLSAIRPGGIIADEAHKLARSTAARAKRIERYLKDNPKCLFLVMSGTITQKSISDYWHLARRSLGEFNPLPNEKNQAMDWAAMVDAGASNPTDGQAGPLTDLCSWARVQFPDEKIEATLPGFRKAYRLRLTSTPGVASSGDADIGVSLIFHNQPAVPELSPGFHELDRLVDQVTEEWVTPNGDEIEHAIHTYKWLIELTCGFFNRLYWQDPATYAHQKGISQMQAEDILGRALDHHTTLQVYHKELRLWLADSAESGLDTPMLVGNEMHRNGDKTVGPRLYEAWSLAKSKEFPGMPVRESQAVLVCPYKLDAAVQWVKSLPAGEGCIVWYYHQAIGHWLKEFMQRAGIDPLHCPAGANEAMIDKTNANRVVIASLTAHGTGKNLQHHKNQYIVQWPRPARDAEQLLGRVHRNGQMADEIIVCINRSNLFDEMNFAATLNDAIYIQLTTGGRQKLVYGTHDPLPKVFSPEALRMRGMDPKILTWEQRKAIKEKFGEYAQ